MNWEEAGLLKASKIKQSILSLLSTQPQTPKDISNVLDKHLSQISLNLKELENMGLVKCLNPQLKKGKFYVATGKAKELMKMLS